MAYDKHTWSTKEAITKSKMQHIEDGIEAASNKADANETNISTLNNKVGNIDVNNGGPISQRLSSMSGDIQTLKNTNVGALTTRLESVENQVNAARGDTEPRPNLAQVLADMRSETARVEREYKSADTTINSNITTAQNTADAAISALNLAKGSSESVADRIAAIETVNRTQDTDIATLKGRMNTPITGDTKSVEQHISSLHTDVNSIQSEIETARGVDNLNVARQNLNARFVDEETRLSNAEGRLATLETSTGTTIPNRIGAVEGRVSTAEGKIANIESELTSAKDTYGSIDARFDAVEATANAAAVASTVNAALETINTHLETLDTEDTGLKQRMTTAESDIDAIEASIGSGFDSTNTVAAAIATKANSSDMETALAGKVNTADMNTALAGKANASDVTTLSGRDTVVISKTGGTSNYTNNIPNLQEPSDQCDYLIEDDEGKYFYWRYINNNWELISGGGSGEGDGTGNTTGIDLTREQYDELTSYTVNTDYYVLENDNVRHHYRYIEVENESTHEKELVEIEIGITNPKKYNIALESIDNEGTTVNYLNVYEFNYDESNTIDSGTDLDTIVSKRINHILLPATGGGGGSSTTGMKILQITSRNTYKAANNDDITKLRFFFTSGEAYEPASYTVAIDGTNITPTPVNITSGDPANRSYSWPKDQDNNDLSETAAAALGFYAIDITQYCKVVGSHTVALTIALDANTSITASTTWNVTTFNLAINSSFTENPTMTAGQPVSFTYVPTGNIDKIAHFILDGNEIDTQSLAARVNTTQTYVVPAQSVGAHKLEAYLTANNGAIRSASIYRDIIWYNAEDTTIILASPYRGNQENISQYSTLRIPYTVVGGTGTYTVKYFVDDFDNSVNEVTLTNTNGGIWNYRAEVAGGHTLRIQCETKYIDIQVSVEALENVDIAPVTTNLALDFNPAGISNTSAKRLWTNGTYSLTVSDNFDWYNGGYGSDVNGDYFLVKAGTRAIFNYPMFIKYIKSSDGGTTSDSSVVYRDGAEFKIIFKTDAVRSADAVWFTNVGPVNNSSAAKEVGIQLNVHNGWLKTDAAGDSTKSYLYFPYSEEDKIELDININKETEPNAVYCMSYEDGCPSRAYPYASTEALYQDDTKFITIGSDDCDVYIYRMRIYNSSLTTEEVLRNFIADGKDVTESVDRYNRNCIYYDTQLDAYTPYENGDDTVLDPVRLAQKIPDVKILMLDTPHFTTSKKDFIKDSTLRCIHAKGGTIFPSRGKEDNWFFGNGYHSGQGTTSDKYGNAGRNVDFLFNCDGTHKPSDKVSAIEGYQSYVIRGYGTDEQEEPEYCTDWKGDNCKVALTATSIPNNFFNLKVNIASSENTNNALLQKRYNDYLTDLYQSLAYARDNRIKNDMEFVPAILFVRENDTSNATTTTMGDYTVVDYPTHTEFNDTEWHFYALGNIGDSKKTDYTRAYDPTDINEFTLEISDNNTNNSQFQTGVYLKNGERTIEPYVIVQDMDDGKIVEGSFTANSTETDIGLQTRDYIFPIDKETEWEVLDENGQPKNMRYWSLMNEGFDGDHTFEMRYACRGNYRDGKLVNDTDGLSNVSDGKGGYLTKDKYQLKLNTKVWQAFYTWLITSETSKFVAEADQWFVRSSMAYFYAFTHYYTMTDNRAKNTFWHFAKTGKHRIATSPVKELLHIYEVADGEVTESSTEPGVFEGSFKPTTDTEITVGTTYYTQYAFDMWAYDMDTALGIDNNGELVFPYGKEDDDYRTDSPSSGDAFNGAGSIFWRRLKTELSNDVTAAFTSVNNACFNADNLIIEFDKFQSCYPEAIWRLDVERKYIRSFTGDEGIKDNNPYQKIYLTRKETRFLSDMMQGRKKYQRRQWIKNQAVYFGSKYFLPIISTNQNDMVCWNPGTQNVMPNWDLTITPYQDMYIRVDYAETSRGPFRAKAGKPVEITCPFNTAQETRVRIYGADYIQALAGKAIKDEDGNIIGANSLASLYFGGNSFSNTHKLRELIIGSDDPTYNNALFTSLNLSSNSPILETLDIQNCSGLSGSQDLSGATALKTVKAQGTSLTQIILPNSTNIENLYLPSTTSTVMLVAAKRLKNISFTDKNGNNDMSNLITLIVNDSDYSSTINWLDIANTILPHINNLQLLQLNYASIVNINTLDAFVTKKKELGTMTNTTGEVVSRVNLSGIINVTGDWSQVEKNTYETIWPNLTLNTTGQEISKVLVRYINRGYQSDTEWVPEQEITTKYVTVGDPIPDIYSNVSVSELPTRDATIASVFQFGTINQSTYRVYSGWTLSKTGDNPISLYTQGYTNNNPYRASASMNGQVDLYTLFNATPHKYTVNWYLDSSTLIKSESNQDYGGGYELEAPTVKDIRENYETIKDFSINSDNTVTYSIFDGWQKLPTNISPTLEEAKTSVYNIYAKWYTNTVNIDEAAENGLFNDTSSPTLEQLLVFSRMSNTDRNSYPKSKTIVKNKKFNYQMGFNGTNNNGTVIVNTNAVQTFTSDNAGNSIAFNNIKPFSTNNGFTLAIDYQFDDTQQISTDAAILMGCYDKVNGNITGFALYNNTKSEHGPTGAVVGYGNMFSIQDNTKSVGVLGQRNMLVIRHPANSSRLWIYSSRNTNSASLEQDYVPTYIDLTTQTLSENAVLCLGHLRTDINTNSNFSNEEGINTTGAQGTIYWLKYWGEDLGAGECQQLAQWPHENMTSIITAISDDFTQEVNGNIRPALYFMGLNNSSHGMTNSARFDRSEGTNVGWNNSAMKTICDERIFNGLPIRLQSILSNIRVGHFNYLAQYNTSTESMGYALSNLQTSTGYVYLPSISSLTFNVATYNNESIYERNGKTTGTLVTDITPYSLYEDAASMVVYDYYNTGTRWREASAESAYYNLRFTNKPISWSTSSPLRIYRIARSAIPNGSTLRSLISNLESGDIVVLTNEAAYMYVSTDDLSYGLQTEPQTDIFNTAIGSVTEGGWIRSQSYITRSVTASSSQYNNFIYINALGVPIIPDNSNSQPGLINLDYAFTI